jgi:hypothetical protein
MEISMICLFALLQLAVQEEKENWIIQKHHTWIARHEVAQEGSYRIEGKTVVFLFKGITEKVTLPELRTKPSIGIGKDGEVWIDPEFWSGMDQARAMHERDEEWQRKGYSIEFRSYMAHTLRDLANGIGLDH